MQIGPHVSGGKTGMTKQGIWWQAAILLAVSVAGHGCSTLEAGKEKVLDVFRRKPTIIRCDVRIVAVEGGSIKGQAGGTCEDTELLTLAKTMAEKLQSDMPEQGQSVAVVTLRNRSNHPRAQTICDEVADKLTGALVETHWFDVKERVDLRTILSENELESAGMINNPGVRSKIGGVHYLIIGGVTVSGRAVEEGPSEK